MIEFGAPGVLLKDRSTEFYQLCRTQSIDEEEFDTLVNVGLMRESPKSGFTSLLGGR